MSEQNDTVTTRIQWRVESDTTEDEFGTDEAGAREWLAEVQRRVRAQDPHWEPAVLMSRTVTIIESPWQAATPPAPTTDPRAEEACKALGESEES